ncbi:tripartite tricarboxylate transporter substrate binding protein BugD [Bradyrhizobium sp. U87765 SZCCT0131]|uniref:tripartite tricarboxylate transporter substrate-binding protein n=1 Tax=unclassified Bradyrhizobium TaxID=2631580 RepID=UPI001BA4B33F|nr:MULTISPECIES: tripartite tricarboxylate transporter substrate-binding protein [unclassified Bradyrhizobium]MBR1217942.1 tripartite tricarboxylate transporter substrate binding protein BugD [Bradyrhizobium sp. U87765 SZCCT0131]MBR1261112.1 tripartite tricarboxylate transporter substrate binding protein BugD [Bradyrhizobium sp. U87765 SZCCT0134]MBR1303440.1 tripartite tricarboxylate transporter substrate binding protein BugD [Bradyrhizobium sp. U87765 SZCCT0110]MBR1319046.1 tripartite tricarbo
MSFAIRCRRLALALLVLAGVARPGDAAADDYPTRIITLVVPFAAGGPSDVIARLLAHSMSQTLGQQVIVENVAGAGGTIGAARVARTAPDGYTLLIHHLALTAAPSLYSNLSYDTRTAFTPLGLINTGPMVLVGRKTLAAQTAQELVAYFKREGDKITMAHAGVGSNAHLCAILLSQAIGLKQVYVPYNGTGPAMNDIVTGQVDALCDQSTTAVPQIVSGTVRGYIVTSATPIDAIKEVATAPAAGLPEFDMAIWHGLYAPKDTPPAVVAKLNKALAIALADSLVIERFKAVGTTPFPPSEWSPEAHKTRFLAEIDRWGGLLKTAGVTPATAR